MDQLLVLDGESSSSTDVLSGVPQGTVLGPLLFLLYVNDIGDKVLPGSSIKLFADDCLLYRPIFQMGDQKQLQQDLDALINWSKKWLMKFNADKCYFLKITRQRAPAKTAYSIDGKILERVDSYPYLGVDLRADLSWRTHINKITGKANGVLNFIRRHLYSCNLNVKEKAYTSLVRPHLEYASSVWDPHLKCDVHEVEKIQRKAARFVTGQFSYRDSVTAMMVNLEWLPLQERRYQKRLTTFYKVYNHLSPISLPHYIIQSARSTRSHIHSLIQIPTNYEQYKNSFLPRTIRDWNALPPDLVNCTTVEEFTTRLQETSA